MAKAFASQANLPEWRITFDELGPGPRRGAARRGAALKTPAEAAAVIKRTQAFI